MEAFRLPVEIIKLSFLIVQAHINNSGQLQKICARFDIG